MRWQWVVLALASYYVRMIWITMGYHRYFSHRAFKTSRVFQFVLAFLSTTSAQKGVLWWAANHRHHHKYSDQPEDVHSPKRGFWWSHVGWILSTEFEETKAEKVKDLTRYPELVWLNEHYLVPVVAYAVPFLVFWGWQGLLWGFVVGTVLLWHGTFFINSLAHVFGKRRYETSDTSRNSMILALLTSGEGWHNNHHHYQSTANQGWFWWEVDLTWYVLRALGDRGPGLGPAHAAGARQAAGPHRPGAGGEGAPGAGAGGGRTRGRRSGVTGTAG